MDQQHGEGDEPGQTHHHHHVRRTPLDPEEEHERQRQRAADQQPGPQHRGEPLLRRRLPAPPRVVDVAELGQHLLGRDLLRHPGRVAHLARLPELCEQGPAGRVERLPLRHRRPFDADDVIGVRTGRVPQRLPLGGGERVGEQVRLVQRARLGLDVVGGVGPGVPDGHQAESEHHRVQDGHHHGDVLGDVLARLLVLADREEPGLGDDGESGDERDAEDDDERLEQVHGQFPRLPRRAAATAAGIRSSSSIATTPNSRASRARRCTRPRNPSSPRAAAATRCRPSAAPSGTV